MRILIVEDSPQRQALLSLLLAPHQPVLATGGKAAVTALEGPPFDLVFLDHDLEDAMTGAEVAMVLARMEPLPEVIVHSMNPEGVAAILEHLPEARVLPIAELHPRGTPYSLLKSFLIGGKPDWDRCFEMLKHRSDS